MSDDGWDNAPAKSNAPNTGVPSRGFGAPPANIPPSFPIMTSTGFAQMRNNDQAPTSGNASFGNFENINGFGSNKSDPSKPVSTFGNLTSGSGFNSSNNNQMAFVSSPKSGFGTSIASQVSSGKATSASKFVMFNNNGIGGGFNSSKSRLDGPDFKGSPFGNSSTGFAALNGFSNNDNQGSNSNDGCRRCGESDHFMRDCTQPAPQRDGCHRCGESGHISKDCAQPRPPPDSPCKFCNGVGHWQKDCPQVKCANCRQTGHYFLSCSTPCSNCNEPRHTRRDCTKEQTCRNCGVEGHMANACQQSPKPREDGQKPPSTFVREDENVEELLKTALHGGSMFDRFYSASWNVTGRPKESIPKLETFGQLGLDERFLRNLEFCQYKKPTPVQQISMPLIKAGSDLMVCSQTGSGKTAAYLIPTMNYCHQKGDYGMGEESCHPRILVIVPTRELAVQVYNESRKYGYLTPITSVAVYGGTSVAAQRNQLKIGKTIVAATLGRLKQFIEEGIIVLDKVHCIVYDEVDRLMEQDTENIMTTISNKCPVDVQKIMFSATFPGDVQIQAKTILKPDFLFVTVDKVGAANSCITQEFVYIESNKKQDELMKLLDIDATNLVVNSETKIFEKKTLIFVSKKSFVDVLAAIICQAGIPATSIHADRLQNERNEALRDFVYGRKAVLVASAILERGLDIKGVDLVINYDMPFENGPAPAIDQYVHRIGRTGRVGNPGLAVSFMTERDLKMAPALVNLLNDSSQVVPDWLTQASKGEETHSPFGGAAAAAQKEESEPW